MEMKKIDFDKKLLYVLLLPLFFLLHGINENYGLIPGKTLLKLSLLYIGVTVFVVVFSLLLLRKSSKAVVFSFYFLSVFFLFGAFHDFLKSSLHNSFFVSYSFLLPLIAITTGVLFISIRKRKNNGSSSMRYFYYLVITFVVLELATLIYNGVTNKALDNNISGSDINLRFKDGVTKTRKPDIYFIVFDGYTSSQCLKEEFNYDNSEIDSMLIAHNFFLSRSSKSNYNLTAFSLSSTWNLNYLRSGLEQKIVTSKGLLQAINTFKKNQLVKFLNREGYAFKNYGCLDIENFPTMTTSYFDGLEYRQIDNQTFSSRIWKDIGWNFTTRNILTGKFRVPKSYTKSKYYHLYRNTFNLDGLINELNTRSDTPKFIYAHIMLPHEPFYLDSAGNMTSDTAIISQKFSFKEGYLAQLKYSNTLLKKIIPFISKKSNTEKVVIIQGDHGYRDYDESVSKEKQFMNLNTYYFSDGDYNNLYEGISPVNSFRVILNKYFSQSFPLLKDSSIFLVNQKNAL